MNEKNAACYTDITGSIQIKMTVKVTQIFKIKPL